MANSGKKKLGVIAAAGVVALGAAGLYAGALTLEGGDSVGAGVADVTAACTDQPLTVIPGPATWEPAAQAFEFSELVVQNTGTAGALSPCVGQRITANIHLKADGSVVSTGNVVIQTGDATGEAVAVPLGTPVSSELDPATHAYGVLIQAE